MYLMHHGVKGMRWGVRRYQKPDGTRTALGKKREYGKLSSQNKSGSKRSAKSSSNGEQEEGQKKGLSNKQKTAIAVGAGVVGTALAVYGGYKVSKYLGEKREERRRAADIINTVKKAKWAADDDYVDPEMIKAAISRKATVSAPNTRQFTSDGPERISANVKFMSGATKMTDAEFAKAQALQGNGQSWRENEFWNDARRLAERPDYEKVKAGAMKQYNKDLAKENKLYRKAQEKKVKEYRKIDKANDKYYRKLSNERLKQERKTAREENKKKKKESKAEQKRKERQAAMMRMINMAFHEHYGGY